MKKTSTKKVKPKKSNSKKYVETEFGNVPIDTKPVKKTVKKSEQDNIIQSLLGDIAFAVNGTNHSSIITVLTKCHKDILNIKKDVGIAD